MKLLKDINTGQLSKICSSLFFLLFTWIITSLILTAYSSHLAGFVPASRFHREVLICGGQILFQFFIIRTINKDKIMKYLVAMMTISFIAGLVLLIFMVIGNFFKIIDPVVYVIFFMITVCAMFLVHLRKMKLLQLNLVPSVTWLLYRLIILTIIL